MGDCRVLVFRPVGCVCGSRRVDGCAHVVECCVGRVVVRAAVPVGWAGYRVEVFLALALDVTCWWRDEKVDCCVCDS